MFAAYHTAWGRLAHTFAFAGYFALSLCLSEAKRAFGGLSYSIGLRYGLMATSEIFGAGANSVSSGLFPAPMALAGSAALGPHSGAIGLALLLALYAALRCVKTPKPKLKQ